jgi:hypothetical protein
MPPQHEAIISGLLYSLLMITTSILPL